MKIKGIRIGVNKEGVLFPTLYIHLLPARGKEISVLIPHESLKDLDPAVTSMLQAQLSQVLCK